MQSLLCLAQDVLDGARVHNDAAILEYLLLELSEPLGRLPQLDVASSLIVQASRLQLSFRIEHAHVASRVAEILRIFGRAELTEVLFISQEVGFLRLLAIAQSLLHLVPVRVF